MFCFFFFLYNILEIQILKLGSVEYILYNGLKYQKKRSMAYRSYWFCVTLNCPAYLVLSDLKGGQLIKCKSHLTECLAN